MAAVNPPAQWVTDQVLDPLADVDRFVEATNKAATYVPQSQAGKGVDTVSGYAATDTVSAKKSDPFSMTKGQLRQFAKENGFDSAVAKEVWQLPIAALRQDHR